MSPARKHAGFVFLTVVCDALAITLSFVAAYHFRFIAGVIPIRGSAPGFSNYMHTLFVIIPVYLWFFRAYGLYQSQRHRRRIEEIFMVMKAITFAVVILMAFTFLYRGLSYSRVYLVALWILSIFLVSFARYFLIQWEYRRKIQKKQLIRVLIVGVNANARNIIQWANINPHYGHQVIGVLAKDASLTGKHLEDAAILGEADQCEKYIEELKPDRVVLVDPLFSRQRIADLVALCEDRMIEFKLAADLYGLMTQSIDVEYMSRVPLLGFRSLPLDDPWNCVVKRAFDLAVSLLLGVLALPVWSFAILLIKLDDGGPVFYIQERMGRDQKIFPLIKFRTMKVDAEKETGPVWAKPDDRRRTRIGNFLRRWNIDELPQLFNVLRGDMSLVGPRPERPHFITVFRESIPRYMARHQIKSGITGWAQVNGYRGDTSIQERIKYDLYYMENWSLLLDIEILFMTFVAYRNAY